MKHIAAYETKNGDRILLENNTGEQDIEMYFKDGIKLQQSDISNFIEFLINFSEAIKTPILYRVK